MRKAFLVGFCFLAFIVLGLYLGFVHAREPTLSAYPVEYVFDCKVLDSSNIRYILRNDIYSKGVCFKIEGENIVLDGNGFKVMLADGFGGIDDLVGVFARDSENLSVKDLQISGFNQGVVFEDTSNSILLNISSNSNAYSGITLRNSSGNRIIKSKAQENGEYGILVRSGGNNLLSGNSVKYNTQGLWSGAGIGISIEDSFGNSLINNSAEFNDKGILLHQSSFNELRENNLRLNSKGLFNNGYGLYLSSSNGNLIEKNLVEHNENDGIYIISSDKNIFSQNIVRYQDNKGIVFDRSNGNSLIKNYFEVNLNGIYLLSSQNNSFTDEKITNSYNDGIYISGVSSGNYFDNIKVEGTYTSYYDINFATSNAKDTFIINNLFKKYNLGGNFISLATPNAKIHFLRALFGEGDNLMREIRTDYNFVVINSRDNPGLDKPSEITFYNLNSTENSKIFRNGEICPPLLCQNKTSLEGPIVVVRVAKSGYYSVKNI